MGAQLTEQQKDEIAKRLWINSNPDIAKSYAGDPRTQLATGMLSEGMSTAPAVGGIAEGIGRLGSGLAGGYIAKQQRGKYQQAEAENMQGVKDLVGPTAAALGGQPPLPNAEPLPAGPLAPPISTPVTTPGPGLQQPDIPPPTPPPPPVQEGPPIPPNVQVANALGGAPPGAVPPVGTAPVPPVIQNPTVAPAGRRGATVASLSPRRAAYTTPPITAVGRPGYAPRVERVAAARDRRFGGKDDPYGSWGAVFGYGGYGRPPKPIPEMTIGEVINFGDTVLKPATRAAKIGRAASGEYVGTSAAGGLQFTGSTLKDIAPGVLGPTWRNQVFTPGVQDVLGKKLFDLRKGGNLQATWEGLPDSTPGAYKDKSWAEMRPLIMKYESGAGGQPGAVGADGGAGAGEGSFPVPAPPDIEIPALPDLPAKPERPPVQQAAASVRWEVANRLLGMDIPLDRMGAVSNEAERMFGPALNETQEARMQQDRQEAALTQTAYTSELAGYNQKDVDRFGAQIGETTKAQDLRNDLAKDYYGAQVGRATLEDTQAFTASESQLERDARMAEAKLERDEARRKAEAFKPPPFIAKEYYTNVNKIKEGEGVLTAVEARPSSMGAKNYQGQALSQRTDPEGVAARAAVAKMAGVLLNKISGAAVTPEEYARNASWLPAPTDTPETIKTKVRAIMQGAQSELDTAQGMFGATGPLAYTLPPTAQTYGNGIFVDMDAQGNIIKK